MGRGPECQQTHHTAERSRNSHDKSSWRDIYQQFAAWQKDEGVNERTQTGKCRNRDKGSDISQETAWRLSQGFFSSADNCFQREATQRCGYPAGTSPERSKSVTPKKGLCAIFADFLRKTITRCLIAFIGKQWERSEEKLTQCVISPSQRLKYSFTIPIGSILPHKTQPMAASL